MGVKGLQVFMETCCPEACIHVDLKQMAAIHAKAHQDGSPTVVVDGMGCLRYWYQCQAWVHGGQWKEYVHYLQEFVDAFRRIGLKLVFCFDGKVEEQKRSEWVKRRLKVNRDIAKIFSYIKSHCQQPEKDAFCLPSGLATFSRFALKSLGQETWCSVREGDYEIAEYALRNKCLGILGQDTDFVIYDTVPYLSISKLRLENMTTIQFSTEKLCHILNLQRSDLPLLACILGNDIVPEHQFQSLRKNSLALYERKHPGDKVHAVADFISKHCSNHNGTCDLNTIPLSREDKEIVVNGIQYYLLPGQTSPWLNCNPHFFKLECAMEKYIDKKVLQAAKEKHIQAECFMVYNVLYDGVVECSNTLEDVELALPPQAVVYQCMRENIYSILLPETLAVKEWFAFPGNSLIKPKIVAPRPLNIPGGTPELVTLWFGNDSEVRGLRVSTFLSIFDLQEFSQELEFVEPSLVAVFCLVTYIAIQAKHLSTEDVDAYLSQAVCIRYKSYSDLQQIRVPEVDPRAVQLGSLFVRGLSYLIAANSTCGFPYPVSEFMPWKVFDGLLFHSKYLQAHTFASAEELSEKNPEWTSKFLSIRQLVFRACRKHDFNITSHPRKVQHGRPIVGESQRESGPQFFNTSYQYSREQNRRQATYIQEQGNQPRMRHHNRRMYHLAPRWPRYPNQRPPYQ